MVWFWFLFVLAAIGIGAATGSSRSRSKCDRTTPPPSDVQDLSPSELAQVDPLEALQRYGTPPDAARLKDAGIDLGALGYRPPSDG